MCRRVRANELTQKRLFYKFTGPKNALPLPRLDQPLRKAIGFFQKEKFHRHWSYFFFKVTGDSNSKAIKLLTTKYAKSVLTSYGNYTKLTKEYQDSFLVNVVLIQNHFNSQWLLNCIAFLILILILLCSLTITVIIWITR